MNKIAKASIAGAAGVILLMGGAGSLAYWNNSTNLGSSSVQVSSGQLSATAASTGTWSVAFNGGTAQSATVASSALGWTLVPGDVITYTQTFNVTATGNDLLFKVAVTNPTLSTTDALGSRLAAATGAPVVKNSGGTVLTANGNGSYSAISGTGTITVSQTFTWAGNFSAASTDSTVTADNGAMGKSYTLPTGGVVTLTQSAN